MYTDQFWHAYGYFTQWSAWKRDPLHRGKQAAKAWLSAYELARHEWYTIGGCPVTITNLRQNPLDPCKLEFSEDGIVWTQFADLSKCGGGGAGCAGDAVLQFDGDTIRQWDECLESWTPVAPAFDHRTYGDYVSLYPQGQAGQCDGAANISAWLVDMADSQLTIMAAGGQIGQLATTIVQGLLVSVGITAFLAAVFEIFQATFTESLLVFTDAAATDITEEFTNILSRYTSSDGTLREPNFTNAINALYARRDIEAEHTGQRIKWGHVTNLLSLAGPYTASRYNKWAGIVDADCGDQLWSHVFDFASAQGKQGWSSFGDVINTFTNGVGWEDILNTLQSPTLYRGLGVLRSFPPTTITLLKAEYEATLGANDAPIEVRMSHWFKNDNTEPNILSTHNLVTGQNVDLWTGSQELSLIIFTADCGIDYNAPQVDPGGSVTLPRITIEGTGTNPFI